MSLPYFQRLGARVDQAWLLSSYDERVFPEIATRLLEEQLPAPGTAVDEIVSWVFEASHAWPQAPWNTAAIGQPSVVVYATDRFFIEALFWFDATTSMHQHAFSGAFSLLQGSSVHSEWSFNESRRINGGMRLGELTLRSVEILGVGAVRPIRAGDAYIHQLFHLDTPSVTIVVRTRREEEHSPQLRYYLPGLALDPQSDDVLITRRLALLDGMLRSPMGDVVEHASRLITRGDLRTVYLVLQHLARRGIDSARFTTLRTLAEQCHGEVIDVFVRAIDVDSREDYVISRRAVFRDAEHRFFLALLLLIPDRAGILALVHKRFPDRSPVASIVRWMAEMSGVERIGLDFNDVNAALFHGLLLGLDEHRALEMLEETYDPQEVRAQRDAILEQRERIAALDLFLPLFDIVPWRDRAGAAAGSPGERTAALSSYIGEARRHVRAMDFSGPPPAAYLAKMRHLREHWDRFLMEAGGHLDTVAWLENLRVMHRALAGVNTGNAHCGAGYHSDDEFIHPGLMRDEVVAAGLATAQLLTFQNQANGLVASELAEWRRRMGRKATGTRLEIRGLAACREALPTNDGAYHYFPDPSWVGTYRDLAGCRFIEALEATRFTRFGAGARPNARLALHAVADYYHTFINGHPFVRINDSVAMTEVNGLLERLGYDAVDHGYLDIVAFNLDYMDFRDYFEEFVALGQRSILALATVPGSTGRLVRAPLQAIS